MGKQTGLDEETFLLYYDVEVPEEETDNQWVVKFTDGEQEWFPKSICTLGENIGGKYIMVPKWLIIDRDLDKYV